MLQFGAWQAALSSFLALRAMQFLLGSTIEPAAAGRRPALPLALHGAGRGVPRLLPLGIVGAFIGVPALIAALSLCEDFPSGRRLAAVLSGRVPEEDDA